jgi:hypothetical protein
MLHRFIFYGTCKNLDLLQKIVGEKPTKIEWGFVRGKLFEVTDEFEPNKIVKYPIAILDDEHFIRSLMITYKLRREEFKLLFKKLLIFEGGLYKHKKIVFLNSDGSKQNGVIFIARRKKIIKNNPKIIPLEPFEKTYTW